MTRRSSVTAQDGLDVESACVLVGWAVSAMRHALASGQDPFAGRENG